MCLIDWLPWWYGALSEIDVLTHEELVVCFSILSRTDAQTAILLLLGQRITRLLTWSDCRVQQLLALHEMGVEFPSTGWLRGWIEERVIDFALRDPRWSNGDWFIRGEAIRAVVIIVVVHASTISAKILRRLEGTRIADELWLIECAIQNRWIRERCRTMRGIHGGREFIRVCDQSGFREVRRREIHLWWRELLASGGVRRRRRRIRKHRTLI